MKIKKAKAVITPKKKTKILEYYYMTPEQTDAKELTTLIKAVDEEKIDVWPELNLMEVVLDRDSLIFQDGRECFVDPLDLEFLEERCVPKTRENIGLILDELELDIFDPIAIVDKTQGRMAEDLQWLKITKL